MAAKPPEYLMTIYDLEKLSRIPVPRDMVDVFREGITILRGHVSDSPINLIKGIIILRGYSHREIEEICVLKSGIIGKILEGKCKISKGAAEKLSRLGYPKEVFLKNK